MPKRRKDGPPDEPVELTRVGTVEAQILVARLQAAGIAATVSGPGTIGNLVAVQFADGARVMVRREDLDAAEQLLADGGGDESRVPVDDADLLAQAEAAGGDDYDDGARV
jgi:hypothetical protein